MRLVRRLFYLLQQRRHARELAEEMEFHRQMAEEASQNRSASRRQIGNTLMAQEDARAVWLPLAVESVFQDLRYGWRSLVKQPSFTAVTLLALVLGIGLNTSLFTVFNAVALRPWPVRDPASVVTLYVVSPKTGKGYGGLGPVEYRYLRDHSHTMSGIFLSRHEGVSLDAQSDGPRTSCHFVTGNYFAVLGVEMILGRGFINDEDNAVKPAAVVVLSQHTWESRYASDPNILGRRISINDAPFTVIGVTSDAFTGTSPGQHDLWAPYASFPLAKPNDPGAKEVVASANWCCSDVAGRMAPGVTREQAAAELTLLAGQYQAQRGEEGHAMLAASTSVLGRPDRKRQAGPLFALLLAAVGSVLLLASANVSNLLLARASARQREIAVRLAIGAERMRVVRQLLTESLLLATLAGALSLLLAYILPGLLFHRFVNEPVSLHLTPDATVLAYTLGISLLSAIAFGLAPALRATRISVSESMKQAGMQASPRLPLRSVLLGVQVTISVVLLSSAALLVRGLSRANHDDLGFGVGGVAILTVDLPVSAYDAARGRTFFGDLLERVRPFSLRENVALVGLPPLSNARNMGGFRVPGRGNENFTELFMGVNAGFFNVVDIPFIAGRNFVPGDAERHAIIINEAFARKFWSPQTAVGQACIAGDVRYEIIGVVRDSQIYGLGPVPPISFSPFSGGQHGVVLLKGDATNTGWVKQLSGAVTQREPRAVTSVISMSQQLDLWLGPARTGATLAAAIGSLALLLATVGVYGVIAYSVEQRRREIGVRMALGAAPRRIVRFIVRANSRALVIGLVMGLAISLATSRVLEGVLYGAGQLDPLAYGGVLLILLAAGIAASMVPARSAARVDPLTALHYE